jgi:cyclopropane-fatty-acyl-phospholipid synthase
MTRRAESVFVGLLDRSVADASIAFLVGERRRVAGKGGAAPAVTLRVHRDRLFDRVLAQGNLGMGEAYRDGDFDMEEGTIAEFLTILLRNRLDRKLRGDWRTIAGVAQVQAANLLRRRQWSYVQGHYDLGEDFFESFLDETMMYSCGYAEKPDDTLDNLQFQKLERICKKLAIAPGDRVLDIGCGFGGFLIHAARRFGATGLGITTSRSHCERGNANIRQAGLSDRIRLELADHRSVSGQFERVVSIGMMEHLPRKEYGRYFRRIADVLTPRGSGLVHCVGTNGSKNVHDPFVQKHVFPGSGQPRLSEMTLGCEKAGLAILDVENIVRHYAFTAQRWLERFRQNQPHLDPLRYDAGFRRLWEYNLSGYVAGATASDGAVYQVLFARDYAAPMPLHRV